jgi:hypothetical protein
MEDATMNVNSSASLAPNATDVVGISVLKKAINIEAQSAMALINAIPPQQSNNLPPNLGQNINTTA